MAYDKFTREELTYLIAYLCFYGGGLAYFTTHLTEISVETHQDKLLKAFITKTVAFRGEHKTPKTEKFFYWCTGWWWGIIAECFFL